MAKLMGYTEPRLSTPSRRRLTRKTTLGFDVIEWAEETIDWKPLPWQRWVLIHSLELDTRGKLLFLKVMILVARQNGKTELLAILILYWLTHGVKLVIASSASVDTALEAWNRACEIAELHPQYFGRPKIRSTNGHQALELPKFRSRYKLVAPNRKGGRGLPAGRAVVDELREQYDWEHISAIENTTLAVDDSQTWYISNAGDTRSVVLNRYRQQGVDQEDDTMFFAEWSAPEGCEIDDPDAWCQANPALGYTLSEERLRSKLGQPAASFRTENLCQSVPSLKEAINAEAWGTCLDPGSLDAHRSQVCAFFDTSLDLRHSTLVVAAKLPNGKIRVETAGVWDNTETVRKELPALLLRIRPRTLGFIPTGPAQAILTDLRALPNHQEITGATTSSICGELAELVGAGRIAHSGDEMMTTQLLGSHKLATGDGWKFSRKDGWADACYATAGAVHLARQVPEASKLQFRSASRSRNDSIRNIPVDISK